jgi:hypothetical protein
MIGRMAPGVRLANDSGETHDSRRQSLSPAASARPAFRQWPTREVLPPVLRLRPSQVPVTRSEDRLLLQRLPVQPEPVDPFDPFREHLKQELHEAARRPPATIPGDRHQQCEVFELSGPELWERPAIQSSMEKLAEQVEATEAARRPGHVQHPKAAMLDYWRKRFVESVEYILAERSTIKDPVLRKSLPAQKELRLQLERAEAKLLSSLQGDALVAQVEGLRAKFRKRWQDQVDRAADRFVELAENEAKFILDTGKPKPAFVFGLPEGLEKSVEPADAPEQLEQGKDASPSAASVVRFMKAVQEESKSKVLAENYAGHEKANPHFDDRSIGHYSFDVHLPQDDIDPQTGFYVRAKALAFFKAVEKASQRPGMNIEWLAFYNDAAVMKEFNDSVGKGRIWFSGGGGEGTFHHGPAPYILHIHFNIMPTDLASKFLVGKLLVKAHKIFDDFITQL